MYDYMTYDTHTQTYRLKLWQITLNAPVFIRISIPIFICRPRQVNMSIRVSMAEANAVSTEALRNIRTVRSFGADLLVSGTHWRRKKSGFSQGKCGKIRGIEILKFLTKGFFRYETHMVLESHGKNGF
jgi:ABC-type multidrug transport system fused ATPase/permease subunit